MGGWTLLGRCALVGSTVLSCGIAFAQAYERTADGIAVHGTPHWSNWIYQNDIVAQRAVSIDSSGLFSIDALGISPRFLAGKRNYTLDMDQFEYADVVRHGGALVRGKVTALANAHLADRLIDGDADSFWEPPAADLDRGDLSKWQINIDLGRSVWVDSIVVRTPAADAPKLFAVEASMGVRVGTASGSGYRFDSIGSARGNDAQGRYAFSVSPLDRADVDLDGRNDLEGSFIHFIRVTVLASDFDQKTRLGEGDEGLQAYQRLPPERRGRLLYRRVNAGGSTTEIRSQTDADGAVVVTAATIYDALPLLEQGPIVYFENEQPRLSEIEVWGPGDNVAYRPEQRAGGAFEEGGRGSPAAATDGVYLTRWLATSWDRQLSEAVGGPSTACCTMWLDLGAVFWIDTIFLGSVTATQTAEGTLHGLHLLGSDGTAVRPLALQNLEDYPALESGLRWTDLASDLNKDNTTANVRLMREHFAPRRLRFFQLRNVDPTGTTSGFSNAFGHFNEVQMYGSGYPAQISLYSPEIPLSIPGAHGSYPNRILGDIVWEAEALVNPAELAGTGTAVVEPMSLHPELALLLQTRTSTRVDSSTTYYQVVARGTMSEQRTVIDSAAYADVMALWADYSTWLETPEMRTVDLQEHRSGSDDDGDGMVDEDRVDGIDNDGDQLIDEDGVSGDVGGPQGRGSITLTRHASDRDDDGDGLVDEDGIDGVDNDGDALVDEDGRRRSEPRIEAEFNVTQVLSQWSAWSAPYHSAGDINRATIVSRGPQKFLQVRARIESQDPHVSARLRSIRVEVAAPLADELAGELALVTPSGSTRQPGDLGAEPADYRSPRDIAALSEQVFAYFLRAGPASDNPGSVTSGFDQVWLVVPRRATVVQVRSGTVATSAQEAGLPTRPLGSSRFDASFEVSMPGTDEAPSLFSDAGGRSLYVQARGDTTVISLPFVLGAVSAAAGSHALMEIRFRAVFLDPTSTVQAFVRHSRQSEHALQPVAVQGLDATELVDSQTTRATVFAQLAVVEQLQLPSVFSPNGDGVNDEMAIQFTTLHLLEPRLANITFHDLSGRLVGRARPVAGAAVTTGAVRYLWDGRQEDGNLAAPGLYLFNLRLGTDADDVQIVRTVNLVY